MSRRSRRRVLLFGATGRLGGRVAAELLRRGHVVVGVSRARTGRAPGSAGFDLVRGEASDPSEVRRIASAGFDVVVSATRPSAGRENELVCTAKALLDGLRDTGTPLVLVGGAARLVVPGTEGRLVLDDPQLVQDAWRELARACVAQYEICAREREIPWTYVSPPAFLTDAQGTGRYRLGRDELVLDSSGRSCLPAEDFAVAVADLVEGPHRGSRGVSVGPPNRRRSIGRRG